MQQETIVVLRELRDLFGEWQTSATTLAKQTDGLQRLGHEARASACADAQCAVIDRLDGILANPVTD